MVVPSVRAWEFREENLDQTADNALKQIEERGMKRTCWQWEFQWIEFTNWALRFPGKMC